MPAMAVCGLHASHANDAHLTADRSSIFSYLQVSGDPTRQGGTEVHLLAYQDYEPVSGKCRPGGLIEAACICHPSPPSGGTLA